MAIGRLVTAFGFAVALAALMAMAPPRWPTPTPAQETLADEIRAIIEARNWPSADWSVLAVSLDTGDTLFARSPTLPLAPASNVKLLTTAAALHYLGPDYRYRTFLMADGPVRDGILEGNLVLYGTGDPALSDRFFGTRTAIFEQFAATLSELGIRRISGDVVGDGTLIPGASVAPDWNPQDLNDWYAAPASGLSFNENVVSIRVEASVAGEPPFIHTLPGGANLPISNHAMTVGGRPGNRLAILRETPQDSIDVVGEIAQGSRDVWRQMTVTDPSAFAASVLKSTLEAAGITVAGEPRAADDIRESPVPQDATWAPGILKEEMPSILAVHDSPPLIDLLEVVNKRSHNLYAELILKTIGLLVSGDGTYRGGAQAVEAFLVEEVGIDSAQIQVTDGSGLSPTNRASAAVFVRTLEYMASSPFWPAFWSTLPEAGNPRELRRMYRTRAAGNLRAKTGTIDRASALSGLVRSATGERILFSILANDVPSTNAAKRIEDKIGAELAEFERSFETLPDRTQVAQAGEGVPELRSQTPRHRVRSGENLTVIARRYGVSLEELLSANPGVNRRPLQVGQILMIPR